MMSKALSVPRLRFPEFRDAEDWNEEKLIDTTDKEIKWSFIGGPFGSNLKSSDYVEDGVRIIQLQNIGDGEFIDHYQIFTSEHKATELLSNNIYPGEIIMSKMGDPVGRACLIPATHDRYVMCSDGIRLVIDEKRHNKYFVFSLINSSQFRALLEKTATGSTRKRIGLYGLKNLPMRLPRKSEQDKVAGCLKSVDDLITAEAQNLDLLKTHKKGLMQQLFPCEGEAIPRLRFPEFRDAGDWDEIEIGDVGPASMCKRVMKNETAISGEIPFFKIGTFGKEPDAYISRELFENYKERYSFPKVGDILISASGTIGRLVVFDGLPSYFQDSNIVWVDNDESLVPNSFLLRCYEKTTWTSEGNAIARLYNNNLMSMKITIPSIPEQQKIADCLTSIDDLITAEAQKLDALKDHKKGLMQQLFPTSDEVNV